MNQAVPLLLTKLQPPVLRRNTVVRERLAEQVRACAERRLTLLCAGAGYGKTTLMAGSLAGIQPPVLWYSLGRSDRDIVTFFSYLTELFDRQWPGFGQAARQNFPAGAPPPAVTFAAACVNELSRRAAQDFILVLDDFQLVDSTPEICQALDQLICHAPPQTHFVVATRTAPGITCLPRLRAEGEAVEIGEADLKFRPDEVASLLAQSVRLNVPQAEAAWLAESIEGWALGLLMAGQTIKGGGQGDLDVGAHLPELAANQRVLFDYLSEEVMHHQPPAVKDFLVSSAILSRLEARECDQALGRSDSVEQLRRLEQHCLFVSRTEDGYLRYHRLFREFLLQHLALDPERCSALHRRAAAFFAEQGNLEAAISHWLEARDFRQAAWLVASAAAEMLRLGRFDTLSFWLDRLPAAEFAELPQLWVCSGQLSEARAEWDQSLECYTRAAQAYNARGDLLGLSDALRRKGDLLNWRKGQPAESEQLHREALSYVGEAHRRKRAALLAGLARDQLSAGHTLPAQTLYREALAIYEVEADLQGQLDTLLNPGSWLYHSQGDFQQALAVLRHAERLAAELARPSQLAESYNNMSVNLYFLGRYADALACAEKALALSREVGDAQNEAFALMNQANSLEMTCGLGYAELYQQYQRVLHVEQAQGDRRFTIASLVFMMILARHAGHYSEALRRGQQALPLAIEHGLRWLAGFVLVQQGAAQIWVDPPAARLSLEEALAIFTDCTDRYHLCATHFWLAALQHSEHDPAYLDHLRACLQLAVGNHYDYFFRYESQAAIPLLVAALERQMWPSYVAPILARIGTRAVSSIRPLLAQPDEEVRRLAHSVLEVMGVSDAAPEGQPAPAVRQRPAPALPLVIQGFGHFSVWRGEQRIEERDWGRRKCKRLFKYIALSPGRALPKDAAVDLLWGDAEPQAANANFYRALYNLRRTLEPLAPHSGGSYLLLEGGLIRLAESVVGRFDVEDFAQQAEEGHRLARIRAPLAWENLVSAVELYGDDLSIDDLYDDWLRPRREQLRDLYLRALTDMADLASSPEQVGAAIHHLRQAFRRDASAEAVCLSLMLCLARGGQRAEAMQHYHACEKALADLGLAPSDELRAVHRGLVGAYVSFSR